MTKSSPTLVLTDLDMFVWSRKMSMTDYDIPNIRRLSLTPRDTDAEETGEDI